MGDLQLLVAAGGQNVLELGHNPCVPPSRTSDAMRILGNEAVDQRWEQILLACPRDLFVRHPFRLRFR